MPAAATSITGQGSAVPAGAAASGGTPARSPSEVLAEAARCIEAEASWYETLGLRWGQAADGGGDVAVEAVLAFNVVSGLIDAANETVLAPVFVVLKELLGAAQGAAAAREEIVELIRYCVGISRCLLDVANAHNMPSSISATLGEFKGEIEAVGRFVQTYGTRPGACCRKIAFTFDDRNAAARHREKLQDLLDAVLAGISVYIHDGVKDITRMITDRDPPRLGALAEIPRQAPTLPTTYVQRTAMLEEIVADLTDPQRSASATHCLLGMGGGGKTLMASSVVREERVRASFKDGMFWIPVGREGKDVALLLEHLAIELARAFTDTPCRCPDRFGGAEEVSRHLSAVRNDNDLRCLVVLDNVWSVEVVNAFAGTGFHVLVTTRQRTVISPAHSGLCTEVGDVSEQDALEILRKASQAHGPLPNEAAREVARDCAMLPLALGIVGALAKEQPLDPATWRSVHEQLREKRTKFRQMENGQLFASIDTSLCDLPLTLRELFQLMAVMASGVVVTSEMLANLWDQDTSDVTTGASVLVDRCLLQKNVEGYRLHDIILEYLQLTIKMSGDAIAKQASSRQARYLGRLDVFFGYANRGKEVINGGSYSLAALWNSVKALDDTVDVEECYSESLKGVTGIEVVSMVGELLNLLGRYSGAENMFRRALHAAEEQGAESVDVSDALDRLALALIMQHKYEEAAPLQVRCIDIEEKASGPDHPTVAIRLVNRANLLFEQGKYADADTLLLRAIEIQEKQFGPDDLRLSAAHLSRASLLRSQARFKEADPLYMRSITIEEKHLGPDHPGLAMSLYGRAQLLDDQGNDEEADQLYLRAIRLFERGLGADHPVLAEVLSCRSRFLHKSRRWSKEAESLNLRAIEILRNSFGPDHPSLVNSLHNRAMLLEAQGKKKEADLLYEKTIELKEKALGPDHPDVATALSNRALFLHAMGKLDEAKSLSLRAIGIKETVLGADHPSLAHSLFNHGLIFEEQGQNGAARYFMEGALAILKKALGERHELTMRVSRELEFLGQSQQDRYEDVGGLHRHILAASDLSKRASLLKAQGNHQAAIPLYRSVIELQEKKLGPDNPDLADSLNQLAWSLYKQGEHKEATPFAARAVEIHERALGPDRRGLGYSLDTLASLLRAQGKYQEADPLYLRAIDVFEQTVGQDDPSLGETFHNRAELLTTQGNHGEARSLFERALAIRTEKLGEGHPDTILTLNALKDLDDRQKVPGSE